MLENGRIHLAINRKQYNQAKLANTCLKLFQNKASYHVGNAKSLCLHFSLSVVRYFSNV